MLCAPIGNRLPIGKKLNICRYFLRISKQVVYHRFFWVGAEFVIDKLLPLANYLGSMP
jgi:hypothetical protein